MRNFFDKFKIPTILGLCIILLGLFAGVYLIVREQTFLSQAAPNLTPQNITVTNITEDQATISWQTKSATTFFLTYGTQTPNEKTILDDKDTNPPAGGPKPHLIHYITLKNLLPKTRYVYKITSGKIISEVFKFETAAPLSNQTGFTPVIGSVSDVDTSLSESVAYLSISGATTQSALIKKGGNFLIPLSQIRKTDLSDIYPLTEDTVAKISIASDQGEASMLFKLQNSLKPLPPIKLGQNIDLTTTEEIMIDKYDLNGDGKINAADNAIILQNFGKKGKNIKGDLNEDGVVDQKDLYLMSKQINQ